MDLLIAEMASVDAGLLSVAGAIGATLTSAIVYLYKRELKCQKEVRHLTRLAQSTEADLATLNVLVEQMQWSGDLSIHGEVVVNANTGEIEIWNPAATAILGWPSRDMLGKTLTKIIPERFRDKHLQAMHRLRQSGSVPKSGPFYLIAIRKDGTEVDIEATYSGWHDTHTGDYFVGAIIKRYSRPKPDSDAKEAAAGDPSGLAP